MRNLDIAQLRALLAIIQYNGVSQAANMLNLTQSAVSMQIKRLEESLGAEVFSREGRKLALTPTGELVRMYARRIVSINDELVTRISTTDYVEELVLGVPSDIVEPYVLQIITEFRERYPNTNVKLEFGNSLEMLKGFSEGLIDVLVTTEEKGLGKEVARIPLHWYSIKEGRSAYSRPLMVATVKGSAFTPMIDKVLSRQDWLYEYYPDINSEQVIQTLVLADLAITVGLLGANDVSKLYPLEGAVLPKLPDCGIYIYKNEARTSVALNDLAQIAERVYASTN